MQFGDDFLKELDSILEDNSKQAKSVPAKETNLEEILPEPPQPQSTAEQVEETLEDETKAVETSTEQQQEVEQEEKEIIPRSVIRKQLAKKQKQTKKSKKEEKAAEQSRIKELENMFPIELFDPKETGATYTFEIHGEQILILNSKGNVFKTVSKTFRWLSPILFEHFGWNIQDTYHPKNTFVEFVAEKDGVNIVVTDSFTPERKGMIYVFKNGAYLTSIEVKHNLIEIANVIKELENIIQEG